MNYSDLDRVMAIERRAYEFPWTEGIMGDCLHVGYPCEVLELDGRVVGYTVLSLVADELHILNLCIDPHSQGLGLGNKLLQHAFTLGRQRHAVTVFLEVRPSNRAALELYRKQGFCEVGTRPNYYPARNGREDAIVMAREL